MTLTHILVFGGAALALGFILRERGRGWLILVGSVLALYWLQPPTPIRHLDFWLPTASLALTMTVWAVTNHESRKEILERPTLITVAVIIGLILLIGLTRYVGPVCCLIPSRPPDILEIILGLGLVIVLTIVFAHFGPSRPWLTTVLAVFIIGLFLVLKTDAIAQAASAALRALTSQPTDQASAPDIRWLGFSYLAFRLLHALRDRVTGKLPALTLQEFVSYALFFPAFTAGPIDRAERFVKDFRTKHPERSAAVPEQNELRLKEPPRVVEGAVRVTSEPFALTGPELMDGGTRIILGVFKKFVLADALTALALNSANAVQTTSTFWMWIVLYAYAWRIYFDFGGYSDIAIGLGRWLGIKLPENFDRPYLKPNLTVWNSWHITLAQWFRAYFFNPLTRALRSRPLSPAVIIFIGQASTMILIGLWHGVTWNFVAWGAWHAVGLFVHNRWAEFARARLTGLDDSPWLKRFSGWIGIVLTFHYVALGWVWFALPSINLSLSVFRKLFGMG
jgi:D-alanyl-lipoteichoic acid acyltransferase DltB (MBOAT superfamily)